MAVEVVAPEEYTGDVIGNLSSRRGMIEGMEMRSEGLQSIKPSAFGRNVWLCNAFAFHDPRSRDVYDGV